MWIFTMSVPSLRAIFNRFLQHGKPQRSVWRFFPHKTYIRTSLKHRRIAVSQRRVTQCSSHHHNNTVTLQCNSWKNPSIIIHSAYKRLAVQGIIMVSMVTSYSISTVRQLEVVTVGTAHSVLSSIQAEQTSELQTTFILIYWPENICHCIKKHSYSNTNKCVRQNISPKRHQITIKNQIYIQLQIKSLPLQ